MSQKKSTIFASVKCLIYASLLGLLYFSTLQWLIHKDWARPDYSYGYLIPLIVAYLIWEKRETLFSLPSPPSWKGLILFLPGICLFWLGELGGEFFTQYVSLWCIVVALVWLNMGEERLKAMLFPLVLALAMFPLPNFFNNRITLYLKLISTTIGVKIMRLFGMTAFQDGNIIDLGFTQLQVVDACSGLRYLFPLIVLGILMAYFFRSRWWKKVLIVLSTIPITIFTNSLRIALTGILSQKFGTKAVEGFFHDFEGWLIFMVAFALLALEMLILAKLFPEAASDSDIRHNPDPLSDYDKPLKSTNFLKQPQFIVSVILLSLTLILSKGVEFREAIPMSRSFDSFPMEIGKWQGTPQTMETIIIDALDLTDYIMVDYHDGEGHLINFYVAYYESQRKGESIHSPATCLRGSGWSFAQSGSSEISLDGGATLPVNRAVISKGPYRQVSYYWFPMRGRILTNAFQMKWFNFWDALTRQRTDGALVRVIAPVGEHESAEDAEMRLQTFVQEMLPVLRTFLPE
ncbi:conserved membrane hypothetical protein [Desulfamplus magnetovallimortis]|uniref:Methanolan biosynthesis EpsI domain-containing protein n=2 Tax=Desulfamplus magnetovallimortis TaxID=1246637 RepID=A0A1W1H8B7_9BACT|nr:conserved membrane hypothetical protein [Desulfamplus magnetovallimortis]